MLLRSDEQMALNDVATLCIAAADQYAAAVQKADDAALARLFAELAQERERLAAELAAHIHALDDLPQHPDPDKEAVDELISGVKALFSADGRTDLIDERVQCEQRLAHAARSALQQSLPPQTKAVLDRIAAGAETGIARLQAARDPRS